MYLNQMHKYEYKTVFSYMCGSLDHYYICVHADKQQMKSLMINLKDITCCLWCFMLKYVGTDNNYVILVKK